jgi:hypothetical protein
LGIIKQIACGFTDLFILQDFRVLARQIPGDEKG